MPSQFQLTFRDLGPSDALAGYAREKATKLDAHFERIVACRVAISAPHRHHHQGGLYRVRIDMVVPGAELVAGSSPELDAVHRDVYAALDDAFDDAVRVLSEYAQRRRGEVKPHEGDYRLGEVVRWFPDDGYGFIGTFQGDEVYFHEHSVLHHAAGRVHVGTKVRFVEEDGQKGPQASTVVLR